MKDELCSPFKYKQLAEKMRCASMHRGGDVCMRNHHHPYNLLAEYCLFVHAATADNDVKPESTEKSLWTLQINRKCYVCVKSHAVCNNVADKWWWSWEWRRRRRPNERRGRAFVAHIIIRKRRIIVIYMRVEMQFVSHINKIIDWRERKSVQQQCCTRAHTENA